MRIKTGQRPNVDSKRADIRVHIHISENDCEVFLDSSGSSLNQRGYRKYAGEAPLNEVLAAGLVLLSEWDKKQPFIDPMCGSGTIAIEAALYAYNIPPGIYRKKFSFENWKNFDNELWNKVLDESEDAEMTEGPEIYASDSSQDAIDGTHNNVANASLLKKIKIRKIDINELPKNKDSALLITNPPYGERIKKENINEFYSEIGTVLKHKFTESEARIFSANTEAFKHIGLRADKKYKLFNGSLECSYRFYSMFHGKKNDE